MLKFTRTLADRARPFHCASVTSASSKILKPSIPVDDLAIPLSPPYSIADCIPPPTPLSREHLVKLHRLAALTPPTTEERWEKLKSLDDLVAIVDQIRFADTNSVAHITDARIRSEAEPLDLRPRKLQGVTTVEQGREILGLAKVRDGAYYVVRTPAGLRGKKRAAQPHDEA